MLSCDTYKNIVPCQRCSFRAMNLAARPDLKKSYIPLNATGNLLPLTNIQYQCTIFYKKNCYRQQYPHHSDVVIMISFHNSITKLALIINARTQRLEGHIYLYNIWYTHIFFHIYFGCQLLYIGSSVSSKKYLR